MDGSGWEALRAIEADYERLTIFADCVEVAATKEPDEALAIRMIRMLVHDLRKQSNG